MSNIGYWILIAGLVCAGYTSALAGQRLTGTKAVVFQAVAAHDKSVSWDGESIIEIDVNCDGKKDYAILGRLKTGVAVGLVVGPATTKSRVEVLRFRVGGNSQDSLCRVPAMLRIESLDYDPIEEDVGALPGFRRSKQCSTFSLADDACDSFHFYWNHDAKELWWWRR